MHEKLIESKTNEAVCSLHTAIIKTLLYFDIFSYPLKLSEIVRFLGAKSNPQEVGHRLKELTDEKYLYQFGDFYSVQNNIQNVVRRGKGNIMARKLLPIAEKKARIIGRFPFVQSVMASGSLSKGFMDEQSDLDFFIVTKPGRLWIARMLLVLYKRVFLRNSHRYFCINYFISSEDLEIGEKNQFTATELATVVPLYGHTYYRELIKANPWVFQFFPNYVERSTSLRMEKQSFITKSFESFINLIGGNVLDRWCMALTQNRWKKIYRSSYSESDFEIAFKSKKNVSKNHPRHYQKKITTLLEEKWRTFQEKHNLSVL